MSDKKIVLSEETAELIFQILKKGNTVELKLERGQLVIVEIQRRARQKTSIIG